LDLVWGFEFADEVIKIMIECLQLPGVDALKGGFCEIDALYDTLVDSVDAGEDIAGGNRRMVRSLRVIPCRGHYQTRAHGTVHVVYFS
jgi:hypothetical protein